MFLNTRLVSRFLMSFFLCLFLSGITTVISQAQELPITTSSQEAMQLFKEGRNKLANVQRQDAAQLFEQAVQKDPDFAQAYIFLAMSSGDFKVINNSLKKASELASKATPGEQKFINCIIAQFQGNDAQQKDYLSQLLNEYPNDKIIQLTAGNFYYGQDDYQTAINHYNKALAEDSEFAPPYNMIGYAQSQLGNYSDAEKAFKKYIALIPNNPNPYDSYAELLQKTGKYDESIVQYKKALAIDPNFISSYRGIGDNYLFKGDYNAARQYYEKQYNNARAIGDKLNAIRWEALSYIHEGNIPQAVQTLTKEREMAQQEGQIPDVIGTHLVTATVLTQTGSPDEGLKHVDEAASVMKENTLPEPLKESFHVDVMLNRAHALAMQGQYEKATAEATEAKKTIDMRQNQNDMKNWNLIMGVMELQQKNAEKAMSYLNEADAESPVTWFYKAEAYNQLGNKDKAQKLYKKTSSWNVNNFGLALVRNMAIERMKGTTTSGAR